jgi:hypothetical protein
MMAAKIERKAKALNQQKSKKSKISAERKKKMKNSR